MKAFHVTTPDRLKFDTSTSHKAHKLAKLLSAEHEVLQSMLPKNKTKKLNEGEYWSWVYSLPHFASLLSEASVNEDNAVILEGILQVRSSLKRIDAIICGQEEGQIPSVMLWEFKRWNDSNGYSVDFGSDDDPPETVKVLRDGELFRKEEHPSVKVGKCRSIMHYRIKELIGTDHPKIGARAYSYFDQQNVNFPQPWRYVLRAQRYKTLVKGSFPEMITRNNVLGVTDAISKFIGKGDGEIIQATLLEKGVLGLSESKF
jgi:hypothetical protein